MEAVYGCDDLAILFKVTSICLSCQRCLDGTVLFLPGYPVIA